MLGISCEKWRDGEWTLRLLLIPGLVLLVPIFIVPTVVMITNSVGGSGGWLQSYQEILQSQLVIQTVIRSVNISATVTAISLVLGLPYAAVAIRATPAIRAVLIGAVVVTMFFSVIVRAYAWLALLSRHAVIPQFLNEIGIGSPSLSLANNRAGTIIGMVQYGIPFMVLAIYDVYRRLDRDLGRAAEVCGAGPITRYVRITFPLLLPGITAGVIIVFVVTLGYYVIPQILGSPRDLMIGQLISNQLGRLQNLDRASALSTLMLIISVTAFCIYRKVNLRNI